MTDPAPNLPWAEVLSGLGEKGPACIRVWTGREMWLLDTGVGPEATSPFNPEWLEGADRVFISHDHVDHIGGAAHAVALGLPIHATAATARALPPGADLHLLPVCGHAEIDGTRVTTGQNGHALGGIWMHLALGQGLFYSGDWSEESLWFAFDPPRGLQADVALLDCSYHLSETPQSLRRAAFDHRLQAANGKQVLLPVPPSGRAGEIALHLLTRGEDLSIDLPCREAIAQALDEGGVAPGAGALKPLLSQPFDPGARYLICDTPNADGGMAWRIVQDWRDRGRLGRAAEVLFTGHMTAHARAIAAAGGSFLRWNVHPPLGDQVAMLRRLGARRFAPLFCPCPEDYLIERTGAALILNERIAL